MFVDTPGSDIGVIRDALITADAIVLPVQPSPMDLLAQEAACNLIEELDKGDVTLFILNRIEGRSTLGRELLAWLTKHRRFRVFEVRQRPIYARAAIVSRGGGELDKEVRQEMHDLWGVLQELMAR